MKTWSPPTSISFMEPPNYFYMPYVFYWILGLLKSIEAFLRITVLTHAYKMVFRCLVEYLYVKTELVLQISQTFIVLEAFLKTYTFKLTHVLKLPFYNGTVLYMFIFFALAILTQKRVKLTESMKGLLTQQILRTDTKYYTEGVI